MQHNFYKRLIIFTIIIAIFAALIQYSHIGINLSIMIWPAIVYFFALAALTYFITNSGAKKNNKTFITRTYSAIGIRFIFSIFPLGIYLFFYPEQQVHFMVAYILLYFFYTSFEIYFLVITLRPDLKK